MTTIKNSLIIKQMNTKKTDWYRKPRFDEITLHSYKWMNNGKSIAFFTLGETENCRLHYECSDGINASFSLFHTPSDTIEFSRSGIRAKLFGADMKINTTIGNRIELRKEGEKLSFYTDDGLILSTENPVFTLSASIAFTAEGSGSVYLEVF